MHERREGSSDGSRAVRGGRRLGVAAAVITLVVGACATVLLTSGDADREAADVAGPTSTAGDLDAELDEVYPLPYGLEQVPGTAAIGRPMVTGSAGGDLVVPAQGDRPAERFYLDADVRAAYRVTSDDPLGVFEAWLRQLSGTSEDTAPLPGWACEADRDAGRWCRVSADFGDFFASLELWVTDSDPILLVDVNRSTGEPSLGFGGGFVRTAAPAERLSWPPRGPGDLLIEEQGFELHLPEATRAETPEIPTSQGSAFVVFAAEDGAAAAASLVDEGLRWEMGPEATGPARIDVDGMTLDLATLYVPAGGPKFTIVSVRGPGDPVATVYVTTVAG